MTDLPDSIEALNGSLPGHVEAMSFIESGAQGHVFQGTVSTSSAATKVYAVGQVETRIEREIEALKKIDCPHIARLLWHGKVELNGNSHYVVASEFIDGQTLNQALDDGPMPFEQVSAIALSLALAIDAMWEHHIVHRDIKPHNILMRQDGTAVLIDLGLARHLGESSITIVGATWGTRGYLSPEQSRAVRQLTCKSDIYALGIVILQSLLGRHPTNGNQQNMLASRFSEALPGNAKNWPHATVLKRMLQSRPIKRPNPTQLIQTLLSGGRNAVP